MMHRRWAHTELDDQDTLHGLLVCKFAASPKFGDLYVLYVVKDELALRRHLQPQDELWRGLPLVLSYSAPHLFCHSTGWVAVIWDNGEFQTVEWHLKPLSMHKVQDW